MATSHLFGTRLVDPRERDGGSCCTPDCLTEGDLDSPDYIETMYVLTASKFLDTLVARPLIHRVILKQ